jgi:hypothetical protein
MHIYDDSRASVNRPSRKVSTANPGGMSLSEWKSRCPYGVWRCRAGREVLFNRSYWPILERYGGRFPAKPANPGEWIEAIVGEKFFWDDYTHPQRNPDALADMNAILIDWGLPTLPPAPTKHDKVSRLHALARRPYTCVDPKTLPRRVNPWAYPFGHAPVVIVRSKDPDCEPGEFWAGDEIEVVIEN